MFYVKHFEFLPCLALHLCIHSNAKDSPCNVSLLHTHLANKADSDMMARQIITYAHP